MKTTLCTVFWVGKSRSGNSYVGVSFTENGFVTKKFVQVTEEKFVELEGTEGTEIAVPNGALL